MKKTSLIFLTIAITETALAMAGGNGGGGGPVNACDTPNPPPGCPVIPIDNHLIWLFIIGIGLAGYQLFKINKSKINA